MRLGQLGNKLASGEDYRPHEQGEDEQALGQALRYRELNTSRAPSCHPLPGSIA
jgi:hypothetical protein